MSPSFASRSVTIVNPQGMHARPSDLLARKAMEFDSKIEIIKDGLRVDAKSIISLLTLGAECGTELLFEATGSDAEAALEALAELVKSGFAVQETNQ